MNDLPVHLRLTSLIAAILAVACAPATPGGLVLHSLALAEGAVDCNEGPHPIRLTDVAKLHLAMTHPELEPFEASLGIEPGLYMNNCECSENMFTDPAQIAAIVRRSAAAVARLGFLSLNLDS